MGDLQLLEEAVGPPPMNTLVQAPTTKRIIQLRWKLKDSLEGFEGDLAILNEEGNLLSQVLYKIHNRFHNDPGYKDLRMLEKSTKKFLGHNFLRSSNTFLSYLPPSTSSSQLPTSLMARHAALQLYGAAALLDRVLKLCKLSGVSAFQRIGLGHFWGVAAHQLGMVGRLWAIARHMIRTIHDVFAPLRLLVTLLPGEEVGTPLPETLESFLPEGSSAVKDRISNKNLKEGASAEEVQISVDSFLDLGVPVQRSKPETSRAEVMNGSPSCEMGREELPVQQGVEDRSGGKVEAQKTKTDVFSEFHNLDQLRVFLKQETKIRKVSKKTCVTAKLKQEEWKNLKGEVLKAMNDRVPNKSLKLCRKILRKALA